MQRQAFAMGKVENGRMTVMTADGKGYSRPVHIEAKPVVQVVEVAKKGNGGDDGQPPQQFYTHPDLDVPQWLKEHFDKKRVDYVPPRKQRKKKSLLRSIVDYIVEEMIP